MTDDDILTVPVEGRFLEAIGVDPNKALEEPVSIIRKGDGYAVFYTAIVELTEEQFQSAVTGVRLLVVDW